MGPVGGRRGREWKELEDALEIDVLPEEAPAQDGAVAVAPERDVELELGVEGVGLRLSVQAEDVEGVGGLRVVAAPAMPAVGAEG